MKGFFNVNYGPNNYCISQIYGQNWMSILLFQVLVVQGNVMTCDDISHAIHIIPLIMYDQNVNPSSLILSLFITYIIGWTTINILKIIIQTISLCKSVNCSCGTILPHHNHALLNIHSLTLRKMQWQIHLGALNCPCRPVQMKKEISQHAGLFGYFSLLIFCTELSSEVINNEIHAIYI